MWFTYCFPSSVIQAAPTLASAYSISRAVKIPVMCSSGLSAVTAPMALTAGAAGVVCNLKLFMWDGLLHDERLGFVPRSLV